MKTDPTLARIAAANPVATPTDVVDDALFARIVAGPRTGLRSPNRRLVVAIALVAAAIVTSTAVGVDRWLTGTVEPDVTLQEYRDARSLLPLPPGQHWPTLHLASNSVTTAGGGGGFAVAVAMTRWECYWTDAVNSGDAAAQQRSRSVLHNLLTRHALIKPDLAPEDWQPVSPPTVPYIVLADDGGFRYKQRIYAAAAAGDAAGIAQSCRANS